MLLAAAEFRLGFLNDCLFIYLFLHLYQTPLKKYALAVFILYATGAKEIILNTGEGSSILS